MSVADAQVLAAYGRQFWLRGDLDAQERTAMTRGRRADVVTGDRVAWRELGAGQAVIEDVLPRRNALRRSDAYRDNAIKSMSGEPPFSEELLLRVLVAAELEGIACLLIATKADVPGAMAAVEPRLAVYERLGYPVLRVDAKSQPDATRATLGPLLADRTSLLLGQSGMGKSTLVNLLVPGADLATRTISEALQTGKHTTTFTRAFDLEGGGLLVDSPGFQVFGLAHVSPSELEHGMREFVPRLGGCRYYNCSHRHEPGCAIRAAVASGDIDTRRHALYLQLRDEAEPR